MAGFHIYDLPLMISSITQSARDVVTTYLAAAVKAVWPQHRCTSDGFNGKQEKSVQQKETSGSFPSMKFSEEQSSCSSPPSKSPSYGTYI